MANKRPIINAIEDFLGIKLITEYFCSSCGRALDKDEMCVHLEFDVNNWDEEMIPFEEGRCLDGEH